MQKLAIFILAAVLTAGWAEFCNICHPSGYACDSETTYRVCTGGRMLGKSIPCSYGLNCTDHPQICGIGRPACTHKCGRCNEERTIACMGPKKFALCHGKLTPSNVIVECPGAGVCNNYLEGDFCAPPTPGYREAVCKDDYILAPPPPPQMPQMPSHHSPHHTSPLQPPQHQGPQMPQHGQGPQMPQHGQGPQMPQHGQGPQMPQHGQGPQMPQHGQGPQMPQHGQGPQMPQHGQGPQMPQHGQGPQMPQLGQGPQMPSHQMPSHQMPGQHQQQPQQQMHFQSHQPSPHQPSHQQSHQPSHQQPLQPSHQQSHQSPHQSPLQPSHQSPLQPGLQTHHQPSHQQPHQPQHQSPHQPQHQSPHQNIPSPHQTHQQPHQQSPHHQLPIQPTAAPTQPTTMGYPTTFNYQYHTPAPTTPAQPAAPLTPQQQCSGRGRPGRYPVDSSMCRSYLYCYVTGGSLTGQELKCPGTTIFNPDIQKCVAADTYTCTSGGSPGQFI